MSAADPRADAKLQNLPEETLQELWRLRHPEEDGEKLTYEAICVALPRMVGFSVALSSLHGFYRWLEVKRRIDQREDLAMQVKAELAKNPAVSDAQIKLAGQRIFMAEGIIEKNPKVFAEMVKIGQADAKAKREDAKLELQKKSVGLDERRLAILEAKAKRLDDAEAAIKSISSNKELTPEQQRAAVLDKMDEFFGLKKKN